jgi:hypothetical protein
MNDWNLIFWKFNLNLVVHVAVVFIKISQDNSEREREEKIMVFSIKSIKKVKPFCTYILFIETSFFFFIYII